MASNGQGSCLPSVPSLTLPEFNSGKGGVFCILRPSAMCGYLLCCVKNRHSGPPNAFKKIVFVTIECATAGADSSVVHVSFGSSREFFLSADPVRFKKA